MSISQETGNIRKMIQEKPWSSLRLAVILSPFAGNIFKNPFVGAGNVVQQ
jgi:hypothetical protein